MPSIPALPLLALTRHIASFRFFHSHIASIIRSMLAGFSGSLLAPDDSGSSLQTSRASPVSAGGKSRIWTSQYVGRSSHAHASYPVLVHRPALLLHASFGPRLAAVALALC